MRGGDCRDDGRRRCRRTIRMGGVGDCGMRRLWDGGEGVGGGVRRRLECQGNQLRLAFFDLVGERFMLGSRSAEPVLCKVVTSVRRGQNSCMGCGAVADIFVHRRVFELMRTFDLSNDGIKSWCFVGHVSTCVSSCVSVAREARVAYRSLQDLAELSML